jgi:hypothetical protein
VKPSTIFSKVEDISAAIYGFVYAGNNNAYAKLSMAPLLSKIREQAATRSPKFQLISGKQEKKMKTAAAAAAAAVAQL